MSFVATWTILTPDGPPGGGDMTVRTPDDVATLVAELGAPGATAAMIYHDRRPTVSDGADGRVPDHDLTAGVWQGRGYLSYVDDTHDFAVTDGDPHSPAFPADYIEYPAGSGIALDSLHAAPRAVPRDGGATHRPAVAAGLIPVSSRSARGGCTEPSAAPSPDRSGRGPGPRPRRPRGRGTSRRR
jgi:hypothetical protein